MRRFLYYVLPAVVLGGLLVWRFAQNRQQQAQQAQAATARKNAPPNVRVAPAVTRDIVHLFQGVSTVESPHEVRLAPKTTGRLDYLRVREGAYVTHGQVLARIDPSQVQAAVNQQVAAVGSARSNLANAEARYRRTYSLYKQGFIAAQDLDDARTARDVQQSALVAAQAQLANVRSQLSDTVLRSPINGYVTARYVDPGSVVTAGEAVLSLQAMRNVYVTTSAPEDVGAAIRVGMPATAAFDALPGRTFTGRIAQVNRAVDPQSRQVLLRAVMANAQGVLRPGMYGMLTVTTRVTRGATVVPHEAIQTAQGGAYVTVVDDQMRAHRRTVRTGDEDTAGIAILEGVKPGERVIVLSGQPVREGQVVRIDTGAPPVPTAGQPTVVGGGGGGAGGGTGGGGGASAPMYGNTGTGVAPGSTGGANATAGQGGSAGASEPGSGSSSTQPPSYTPQTYQGAPNTNSGRASGSLGTGTGTGGLGGAGGGTGAGATGGAASGTGAGR